MWLKWLFPPSDVVKQVKRWNGFHTVTQDSRKHITVCSFYDHYIAFVPPYSAKLIVRASAEWLFTVKTVGFQQRKTANDSEVYACRLNMQRIHRILIFYGFAFSHQKPIHTEETDGWTNKRTKCNTYSRLMRYIPDLAIDVQAYFMCDILWCEHKTRTSETVNHHPRVAVHRNAAIIEFFRDFDHILLP